MCAELLGRAKFVCLCVGRLASHGLHQAVPPPLPPPPAAGLLSPLYSAAGSRLLAPSPLPLGSCLPAPAGSALEQALRRGLTRLHVPPAPSPPGGRRSPPLLSLRHMIDGATAVSAGGAALAAGGRPAAERPADYSQEEIEVVDTDML